MKIKVTAEHIQNGIASDCSECPVALALQEALYRTDIVVGWGRIWLGVCPVKPPEVVGIFVDDFDSGKAVAPFEFELDI